MDETEHWSGIEVFWEYTNPGSKMTIGISGPVHLLRQFESPTDVMIGFMQAIAAMDENLMIGALDSIHTRFSAKGFSATWVGTVVSTDGQLSEIMEKVTKELGGREL